MAYKLVEYDGRPVLKTSAGRATWTAQKQIYRMLRSGEGFAGDVVALREEAPPPGTVEILLCTVMEGGRLLAPRPTLTTIREYCAAQMAALPEEIRRLRGAGTYPISYSQRLISLQHSLEARVTAAALSRQDETLCRRDQGPPCQELGMARKTMVRVAGASVAMAVVAGQGLAANSPGQS